MSEQTTSGQATSESPLEVIETTEPTETTEATEPVESVAVADRAEATPDAEAGEPVQVADLAVEVPPVPEAPVPESESPEVQTPDAEQPDAEQPAAEAASPDAASPDAEQPAAEATESMPSAQRPSPRAPGAAPRPRPGRGARPGARAAVAARPPSDPTPWGRMGEDGTVMLLTRDGERPVGTVVDATQEEALAHFGREFDAVVAQVDLQEQRLLAGGVAPGEVVGTLRALRSGLADASIVGDVDALTQRLRDLEEMAAQRRAEADEARHAIRAEALAARSELVEEAEGIAATDPERMQWRPAGDRMRDLLDSWKAHQQESRLDKKTEDDLWKRFSAARTSFDRARRTWFSALEAHNSEAKAAKEALVTEAEGLSTSTAWGPTSTAYRQLMERWKVAGRTTRKEDDALWSRFRAAQDVFFAARTAANDAEDTEFSANLTVKEALLTEAEALLPIKDLRRARAQLRDIQERWEAAGKVPRADLARVEKRMRAVESAVNDADRDTWRRSNPETHARAQGAIEQLERAVAGLEADLASARERSDAKAVAQAESSLSARREWLAAARRTAEEFSG